jgi:thiol-disulfide isomerase/thioredoxin
MKPVLEELARKHEGRVAVRIVDMRDPEGEELGRAHRVRLIPTQVFLDSGDKERFRHEGFLALEALEAEIARLGWTR